MSQDPFVIEQAAVRRSFDRAAARYDESAVLQAEVRARLLERLDYVTLDPSVVLDAGCGTGHSSQALAERYPQARVVALDLSEGMLREARNRPPPGGAFALVCGDAMRLPLADASVDLVFSNLTLQWCTDLDAAFGEFFEPPRVDDLPTIQNIDTVRLLDRTQAVRDDQASDVSASKALADNRLRLVVQGACGLVE